MNRDLNPGFLAPEMFCVRPADVLAPLGCFSLALKDFPNSTFPKETEEDSFRGKRRTNFWKYLLCARLCHPLEELKFAQAISHIVARGILGLSLNAASHLFS